MSCLLEEEQPATFTQENPNRTNSEGVWLQGRGRGRSRVGVVSVARVWCDAMAAEVVRFTYSFAGLRS